MSNRADFLKIISSSSHNTEFPYVLCLFVILTKAINTYLFTPLEYYTAYIGKWLTMFQIHPSGPSSKITQYKKNAKQQVDALLYRRWRGKWLVLREGKEDKQVAVAWSCHQDKKEKNMWKEAQAGRHQSKGGKVKKWEVLQNWKHQSKSGKRRNEWGTGMGHTKATVKKLTHKRHRKGRHQSRSIKRKETSQYKWEDKLKRGNPFPPLFTSSPSNFHSGTSYWGASFQSLVFPLLL